MNAHAQIHAHTRAHTGKQSYLACLLNSKACHRYLPVSTEIPKIIFKDGSNSITSTLEDSRSSGRRSGCRRVPGGVTHGRMSIPEPSSLYLVGTFLSRKFPEVEMLSQRGYTLLAFGHGLRNCRSGRLPQVALPPPASPWLARNQGPLPHSAQGGVCPRSSRGPSHGADHEILPSPHSSDQQEASQVPGAAEVQGKQGRELTDLGRGRGGGRPPVGSEARSLDQAWRELSQQGSRCHARGNSGVSTSPSGGGDSPVAPNLSRQGGFQI